MNVIISHLLEKTSFPDLNPPKCSLGTSKSNAAQTKLITFHPNLFVLICILTWTIAAPSTQSKLWRHPRLYTWWVLCFPVWVAQSCPALCNPMDCGPPGSSVHGILQASIVKWGAVPFSRRSSQPRDWTQVSCIAGGFSTMWATREDLHVRQTLHFQHVLRSKGSYRWPSLPSSPATRATWRLQHHTASCDYPGCLLPLLALLSVEFVPCTQAVSAQPKSAEWSQWETKDTAGLPQILFGWAPRRQLQQKSEVQGQWVASERARRLRQAPGEWGREGAGRGSMRTRCSVSCLRPYANLVFQVKRKQGKVQEVKGVEAHTVQLHTFTQIQTRQAADTLPTSILSYVTLQV